MRISDWSSDVCSSDLHVHSPARSIPNCCFPPETSCAKTIRSLRPVAKVETFRLTGKVGECRRSERLDSRGRCMIVDDVSAQRVRPPHLVHDSRLQPRSCPSSSPDRKHVVWEKRGALRSGFHTCALPILVPLDPFRIAVFHLRLAAPRQFARSGP